MVEKGNNEISLTVQAKLLSLNRTGIYYKPRPAKEEEITIKHRIDEIYTRYPFYGSRRITALLKRESININRKRVQRYMQEMDIAGICPGPNLSKRNRSQCIPIFVAQYHQQSPQPYLGHRYYIHPSKTRVDVPGGGHRLVFPLRCGRARKMTA